MTPYVAECQRLMDARLKAKDKAEKDDAEWALTYAMQMHRAGRFDEYLALRAEQIAREQASAHPDLVVRAQGEIA